MSELPKGWAKATLAQLVSPDRPRELPRDLPHLPFVGMEHVEAHSMRLLGTVPASGLKSSAVHFQMGDVLYGRLRPYLNKVLLARFEGLCSAEFIVFGKRAEVSSEWLAYFLNSSAFVSFSSHLNAGDRPRVDFDQIGAYELLVASRFEQDRIVAEIEKQFTRLDAATAALKRVQVNLKRYRASVLKAACEGRLVPTEAELARKEGRDYESAEKLLQRILRERRARWEADTLAKMQASGKPPKDNHWKQKYKEPSAPDTSNLPPLPEGWRWASLGQVFGVYVGATPSRGVPEYWNGSIPWVSSGEVAFCRITSTREAITESGLRKTSTDVHPLGTVLIGMIGEGKTRGQVAILDIAACNNQNSAAIRVSEAGLPPEFIYRYLEGIYEQTRNLSSGNNQPALNKARVQEIIFPLPPLGEQKRICMETERLLSVADATEDSCRLQMDKAQAMRSSILRDAFTGQLVPQDSTDEPASALLERIRAGRAKQPGRNFVRKLKERRTARLRGTK
jgi:type I restriction enzyme S subunit